MRQHFDFAAHQIGVHRAVRTRAHFARDAHHEFIAQRFRQFEGIGIIRVAHDLQQTFAVAHVDKNNAAVIAAAMHPALYRDDLPQMFAADEPAVFATHDLNLKFQKGVLRRCPAIATCRTYYSFAARPCGTAGGALCGGTRASIFLRSRLLISEVTTPMEIIYFNASSILISSSMTSVRLT